MSWLDSRPLVREVLPVARLPRMILSSFMAICCSAALMLSANSWCRNYAARHETIIERTHYMPMPGMCETRTGMWQRCDRLDPQ